MIPGLLICFCDVVTVSGFCHAVHAQPTPVKIAALSLNLMLRPSLMVDGCIIPIFALFYRDNITFLFRLALKEVFYRKGFLSILCDFITEGAGSSGYTTVKPNERSWHNGS